MQPIASWHGQPRRWPSHTICKHWEFIGESQAHRENPTPESCRKHQRNPHRLQPAPKESARLGRNYQAQTNYPRQQIHLLNNPKARRHPKTHNPVRHTECMWPQWKWKIWKSLSLTLSNTKRPEMASNNLQSHSSNQIFHNSNRNKTIRSQKRREGSPAMCEEAWLCASRSGNGDGQITRRRNGVRRNTAWEPARDGARTKARGRGLEGGAQPLGGLGLNPGLVPGLDLLILCCTCARFVAFSHEALD